MNIRVYGLPIYHDENDREYVLVSDLKLALDSDLFKHLMRIRGGEDPEEVPVKWLEAQ